MTIQYISVKDNFGNQITVKKDVEFLRQSLTIFHMLRIHVFMAPHLQHNIPGILPNPSDTIRYSQNIFDIFNEC